MYISIGTEKTVRIRDIIGIFDLDTATQMKATKQLLQLAEKQGRVENTGHDIPKSFLLMSDGRIYLSQYAAKILKRRTEISIK